VSTAAAGRVTLAGAGLQLVGEYRPGRDDRPPVLLLHGGGQTRHSWAKTAERLANAGWPAYALDLRGHGDSDWAPDGDYSLDAYVADLLAVIDTLDRPPVLVGASLGGMTSLQLAGEHPGRVVAIVLVDVVVNVEPKGVQRILDFMAASPDGFANLEEAADAIAAYNPNRPRPKQLDGLRKNLRQGEDGRWRWHWDPAFLDIRDEPQRRADRSRLRAAAQALAIPTVIVRGARSDVVSDEGLAHMLELVPQAEVVDVQAAGHMVAGDDNDVFAERLEAFLERLSDARRTP
jgi:pimeloyl-ACP methyl ester carboxylesterase